MIRNSTGSSMPPGIEFLLRDENRSDGAESEFGKGSAVSMFDYLKPEDQKSFINRFQKEIIEPYITKGQNAGEVTLWEPWLTNQVLIHEGHEGELTGEWLLDQPWAKDEKPDIISFLDVKNKYFEGTHIRAINAYDYNALTSGTWEVDYDKGRVKVTGDQGTFYGLFAIDQSGELEKLKIEFSQDGYPETLSNTAPTYIERESVNMYKQANGMGVITY